MDFESDFEILHCLFLSGSVRRKMQNKFCGMCRGPADGGPMQRCSCCKKRFHIECVNLKAVCPSSENYVCSFCVNSGDSISSASKKKTQKWLSSCLETKNGQRDFSMKEVLSSKRIRTT